MKFRIFPVIVLATCASAGAQVADAPPVDVNQLLQGLKQFKEQSESGLKTRRNTAYQQIMGAASSNEKAAAFWTECVMAVQFAGSGHEGTAFRDWKQGEGEGLKSKEGANAARLSLMWLALTLQHASGAETKQLLSNILDYVRQVEADEVAIGRVEDQIDKAKERTSGVRRPPTNKALADDTHAKKTHDSIMRMAVANTPVAKRLQISELLGESGARKKRGEEVEGASWEAVPGNVDGIFNSIILPEFRAAKDPRILEYWDLKIKKESQNVDPSMADYDERQWTQVRQPRLMWSRAQDVYLIGQRNRALTDMFNLIKNFPQHPDVANWIARLESLVSPAAATSTPATPATPSTPAVVPTATIIPAPAPGAAPR